MESAHPLRHGLGFLIGGATAFCVDAAALAVLTSLLGLHPIIARLAAISLAMIAAWLMHRTYTFAVKAPPSIAEFLRFAGVAWTAAAVNYGVFVLIILASRMAPLAAMMVSSLAAMIVSYLGMRFAAFHHRFRAGRD
jgi:putative flippase GtrA